MVTEYEFSVFDFASSISEAVDLVSQDLNGHHKKVAYISYYLAKEMNMSDEEIKDIVMAALLHDVGALTLEERFNVIFALFDDDEYDQHQIMGYKLLRNFKPFANAATLIKYHHSHFDKSKDKIPIGSYIIHLADRLSILPDKNSEILGQIPVIMNNITKNQSIFHPDTLYALHQIAKMECFWIEACLLPIHSVLPERMQFSKKIVNLEELISLAKVISQIIDFRSRFTSTHSSGVAAVALELSKISGFSEKECILVEIAGYLHDIGKLAIPNFVLEKNGTLNYEEFNEMRKHTYYTYAILSKIKGFEQIAMCAAYHHERLDGNGYPFHVKGEDFPKLARIIAVADIVTAITEDRPYRVGMSSKEVIKMLSDMAENGEIDKGIVEIVEENFSSINDARIKAQQKELQEFNDFYDITIV